MGQARRQTEGQWQSKTEGEVNRGYLQAWGSVLVQVHVAGPLGAGVHEQGNDKVARQMEAAHRTSLAKGEVGIREKKSCPCLINFGEEIRTVDLINDRWKTWLDFYRVGLRAVKGIAR